MGGEGSGGARVGSGRKQKSRSQRWLDGNAGKRPLSLVPAASSKPRPTDEPIKQPELAPAEAAYWAELAPKAIALGTLTPGREPGMKLLCQLAAARDAKNGERAWLDLTRQYGQHLARFGLTADGKPPSSGDAVDDEEEALAKLLAVK